MKTFWIVVALIAAAGLAATGGFWGGMQYQASLVDQAWANFESARGPMAEMPEGGFPGGGLSEGQAPDRSQFQGGGAQGTFAGRGAAGSVKSVEGDTLMLSTAQDVTAVNISDVTVVMKTVTGSLADLEPGMRVMVSGERNDDGSIDAAQISILSEDAILPGAPAATREP